MTGATTSNKLIGEKHDFMVNSRPETEKFRVAHIIHDDAGNLHYREAWLLTDNEDKIESVPDKQSIEIQYADTGETKNVPASEIRIIGQLNSTRLKVGHMIMSNGMPTFRMGTVSMGSVLSNNVWIRYDGEPNPVSVKAADLIVIGR